MPEPLDVLVDMRDSLRDLPDRLEFLMRARAPDRMAQAVSYVPPAVGQEKPEAPAQAPQQAPQAIQTPAQLAVPEKVIERERLVPQTVQTERPASVPAPEPSRPEVPVSTQAAPAPPVPSYMPPAASPAASVVPAPTTVYPPAGAGDSPRDVPAGQMSQTSPGMGDSGLGEKIDELIDAVRSLTSAMGADRSSGSSQRGGGSSVVYRAPPMGQQSAPSTHRVPPPEPKQETLFSRMFGG